MKKALLLLVFCGGMLILSSGQNSSQTPNAPQATEHQIGYGLPVFPPELPMVSSSAILPASPQSFVIAMLADGFPMEHFPPPKLL